MYLDQLDRLDQKILTLLIENARYSYSEDRGKNRHIACCREGPHRCAGKKGDY